MIPFINNKPFEIQNGEKSVNSFKNRCKSAKASKIKYSLWEKSAVENKRLQISDDVIIKVKTFMILSQTVIIDDSYQVIWFSLDSIFPS